MYTLQDNYTYEILEQWTDEEFNAIFKNEIACLQYCHYALGYNLSEVRLDHTDTEE